MGGEFDAIASTTPAEEMEEGTSELGHLSVEDRGPATVVHWEVGIDQSNIRAYQVCWPIKSLHISHIIKDKSLAF